MSDPIEYKGMRMAEKTAEKTKAAPKVEKVEKVPAHKKKEPIEIEEGGPFGKVRIKVKGEWSDWIWSNEVERTTKKMGG